MATKCCRFSGMRIARAPHSGFQGLPEPRLYIGGDRTSVPGSIVINCLFDRGAEKLTGAAYLKVAVKDEMRGAAERAVQVVAQIFQESFTALRCAHILAAGRTN